MMRSPYNHFKFLRQVSCRYRIDGNKILETIRCAGLSLNKYCVQCNGHLMKYQKDGKGQLMRCYLNRIFHPPALERLQYTLAYLKQMSNLVCPSCSTVIGTPMVYDDGRLAFRLRKGFYSKKRAD